MTDRYQRLLFAVLIFGAALLVYSGGNDNGFLVNWDDPLYVSANPDVQSVSLANLKKIFTTFYVGNYAPLQMLSYMLEYQVWGAKPLAFLVDNVLLHALNAVVFSLLLRRMGLSSRWALLAALLFVVHPGQVESVAWISQRKNVLAMTFFLGAFWCYLSYVQAGERRWWHYAASCGLFLLALLTKSVVVILPAVLLLYDVTLRAERGRLAAVLVEKVPYALLTLGTSYLAVISQRPEYGGGLVSKIHGGSAFATTITMLTVYKEYLCNLFWPVNLSAVYEVDIKTAIDGEVLWSAVLLLATVATLWFFRREERRAVSFWLALFFLGFVPVSQIVPINTLMNDRYLYFPMLGFAGYLVLLMWSVGERVPRGTKLAVAAAVVALICLAPLTWQRTIVWASSQDLWRDTVTKQPDSALAWKMLGNSYRQAGDIPTAIDSYVRSLKIKPNDYEHNYELGLLYHDAGDLDKAILAYRKAFFLKPDHVSTLYNLGLVYTIIGNYGEAVNILERGVRVSPESRDMPLLLAANRFYLGDFPGARKAYELARRNNPADPAISGNLSLVTLRNGDENASRHYWQQALALGGRENELYLDWARLEAVGRHRDEALKYIAKALATGNVDKRALENDPDFSVLKNDPEFKRLLSK